MKKYENFCSALHNLGDIFDFEEPYDNVTLTGMVGLFEICFEQSWKMIKEVLGGHGYEESATGSPKTILKTAYSAGIIKEEELWIRALAARNNVTHAYHQGIALNIVRETKELYYKMFCDLKTEIENWL